MGESETLSRDKRFKYNMNQLEGNLVCEYNIADILSTYVSCNAGKRW
jgi:hypothetical protein